MNDYLHKRYQGTILKNVYHLAGGRKLMSCDVFIAAVDYLDIDAFIELFHTVPWEKPQEVQLMIRTEGEDRFKIYTPK
ncbi:hypothetical protein JCM19236_3270 [Vibrio sp. JCM 19236]|nr:hypothetical protein JCM19236_3270 [Vibrio sp. JCM 19236]